MSRRTVHKGTTKHGFNTPHRYPTPEGESILDVFFSLTNDLYPTGRAWQHDENSSFSKLNDALNVSMGRLVRDGKETIESTFPDTNFFNEEDVSLWEFRLGLITNPNVNINLRRDAVLRKLAFPSNIKARQNHNYIEYQLRLAGFDVYVHENTIPYRTPNSFIAELNAGTQHGGDTQHGDATQHGAENFDVIANSVDPNENYAIGGEDNLWPTFFISGFHVNLTADVPAERRREFRELVLKLKPAHTVAFSLIRYIGTLTRG